MTYSEDIVISTNMAKFVTTKSSPRIYRDSQSSRVYRGHYNASNDRETVMMGAKWKNYDFRHQFLSRKPASLPMRFCKISIFPLKPSNIQFYKNL